MSIQSGYSFLFLPSLMKKKVLSEISGVCLQIFQLHGGEGSHFELSDGVGCQVQCFQGNVWLQLMHQQLRDPIVDSESYKK